MAKLDDILKNWLFFFLTGGSKVIRNPHVVSDCQPSNPPGPEPAGTNTHYPRTQHQRRDNFKLGEGVKHSVATGGIRTRVRIGVLTTSRPLAHHPVVSSNSISWYNYESTD